MSDEHSSSLNRPPNGAYETTEDLLNDQEPLHVYDLPQLHQKPGVASLLKALDLLSLRVSNFDFNAGQLSRKENVLPEGVPRYLTSIVSSSLRWIDDDDDREQIWEKASIRLSERSGRSALPSITRHFEITDWLTVTLHEPALTEDKLGLKTWTSSVLLAKRLTDLRKHLAPTCNRALELGAGTGLVGIAASCLWEMNVILTDLPEIVPNLQRNLTINMDIINKHRGNVEVRPLDWANTSNSPSTEADKFLTIVAADPIYSPEHPKLLVDTVSRWLQFVAQARFILELPLRESYAKERSVLRDLLEAVPLILVKEGFETGYDDWQDAQGDLLEVECWWSIWRPLIIDIS